MVESTNPINLSCLQKHSWAIGDEISIDDGNKDESTKETAIVDVDIHILKGVNIDGSQTFECISRRWTAEARVS